MPRKVLTAAIIAVLAVLAGTMSAAAASPSARSSAAKPATLVFQVVFSPFTLVKANNVRNPKSPYATGDELVFHDQLFSGGQHAGDEAGSCVFVSVPPAAILLNCTDVMRLQHGTITAQFLNAPPPIKQLAVTGGTGSYQNVGGEGTLVEFGNGKGKLALHLLSLVTRG